jgi:hypothetical protein
MKAIKEFASKFEGILVDSAPILPIVDVNLRSRLVDGTLQVDRRGDERGIGIRSSKLQGSILPRPQVRGRGLYRMSYARTVL